MADEKMACPEEGQWWAISQVIVFVRQGKVCVIINEVERIQLGKQKLATRKSCQKVKHASYILTYSRLRKRKPLRYFSSELALFLY